LCPRVISRATVFDNAIEIDGITYDNVGDITISESVSGTGLSGVIESTLTVTVFSDFFNPPDNAEVKITTPGIHPPLVKFYIQKREKSGDKIKLICRSRIHNFDRPSDFTDSDFDEEGNISTETVLSRIASLCGFGMTYQNASVLSALPTLEKGAVKGKNCLTLLENIAAALFCTFREYEGNLRLCPFEQNFTEIGGTELLAPVKRGFNKTIGRLFLTNKAESYESGFGSATQTIKAETPFASEGLAAAIMERIHGQNRQIYKPFEAMVKTIFIPSVTALVTLEDEQFYVNDIKVYVKKSGLFAKLSCKAVNEDEWNYSNEISRKISEKIAVGDRFDALLTESKDLVGAINELFTAAPGGGDGIRSIEDLYPFMAASGWSKFGEIYNAYGLHYAEKRTLSTFACRMYTNSNRRSSQSMPNDLQVALTLGIACYNEGDSDLTYLPAVSQLQTGEANGTADFRFNLTFEAPGAFEYWMFRPDVSTFGGQNVTILFTIIEQSEWVGYDDVFYSTQALSFTGLNFIPPNSSSAPSLTVARNAGTNYRNFSYNIKDINRAITAFNANGGT
jgi:hypothetical protein